ncbi:hypothetical protein [Pedobacter sp. Hv1]|uniref:hypothetical protein n=1 Tax=Pedobacter sp. Hv1 TaxID=1740090 RepID=UPI0006D8A183|nr:hypothetical protein [Pedobacter sp. Hv1]KQB99202.1 hypothetical protein AQF98_16620 [Pedobacter sp. Hv1]
MFKNSTLNFSKYLLIVVTLVTLAYACKKDTSAPNNPESKLSSISIVKAKQWIEKQQISILSTENLTFLQTLKLGDEFSYSYGRPIMADMGSTDIVELPINGVKKTMI